MTTWSAMVPEPAQGRVFRSARPARLADADPNGRLRLDAVGRYLHDLSNDDTRDAALPDDGSWVVRRTLVDVTAPARFLERLELATWCGGTGRSWAERRVSLRGAKGAVIDAASLWVYVDVASMAPRRLHPRFLELFGEAAGGRTVGARLELDPTPPAGARRRPWPLRHTDLDVLRHVNNAAYWTAVEELLADRPELVAGPHRAVLEFARPIGPGAEPELAWTDDGSGGVLAWLLVDGVTHAAAMVTPSADQAARASST